MPIEAVARNSPKGGWQVGKPIAIAVCSHPFER
jgi:hypothetical protein